MRSPGGFRKVGRVVAGLAVGVGATFVLGQARADASGSPPAASHVVRSSAGVKDASSARALWRSMGHAAHVLHLHPTTTAGTNVDPTPAHWSGGAGLAGGVRNGAESSNWSGQIDVDAVFTGVLGEWVVPTVQASTADKYSGTWVGIDGATNSSLIQVGTSQNSGGSPNFYDAWYEILPADEVQINEPVSPGDVMEAAVAEQSAGTWAIAIEDVTAGWEASGNFAYSGPGASAEWIEEAPTVNNVQSTLADYGSMTFSNLEISSPDASASGLIPVSMANASGVVISYPGSYNETTDSFPIIYGTPRPVVDSVTPASGGTGGGTAVVVNGDYLTGATAVDFGSTPVAFTVNPDNSLSVTSPDGSAGTVDVTVTTPGGTSAKSSLDQFTYELAAQAITFASTAPTGAFVGGPSYTVSATGGASGNPVTFSIDSSAASVCSISGASVSFTGVGTCTIDANQAGNGTYGAAPQVQQQFIVGAAAQAITSADSATATVGTSFSFTVTTSGTPVPSLSETGKLAKHLKFANKGNGTAVISGTPTNAGVSHLTLKATFGKGKTKHVVSQTFTLTVDAAP